MTPTLKVLNEQCAIAGQLSFRQNDDGLIFAEVDNDQATATICLQGAHVVTWKPKSEAEPVVWVSEAAKYAPGKSIRGGVPICWPWFGAHASESSFPGHGFARTVMWDVAQAGQTVSGATQLVFVLLESEQTRSQWPHPCRLELRVTVGSKLDVALVTTNTGAQPFQIGEALHTYFQVGDIADIRVTGLDGTSYLDKVGAPTVRTQSGPVTFEGEVDRVYVDTGSTCVIEDARLGRRIHIAKQGSRSTVLWTPWLEKADKMGDFGPGKAGQGGWREMVCVESGNALDDVVTVPPGASHSLSVTYSVEPG